MANHVSALKRVRQNRAHAARNRAHNSRLRTAVKKLRAAIAESDAKTAAELYVPTISRIDKSIQKGVLHKNAAARYKSSLTVAYRALSQKKA